MLQDKVDDIQYSGFQDDVGYFEQLSDEFIQLDPQDHQFEGSTKGLSLFPVNEERIGNRNTTRFKQTKIEIGQPNDKFEQEADRVADLVVRRITQKQNQPKVKKVGPLIQQKCKGCRESQKAPMGISSKLKEKKMQGQPLPPSVQKKLEQGFGFDFSNVRVHTDGEAVEMNQLLGAKAFAYGSDVYFNKGEYRPNSSFGQRLLAHELTHVIQQVGGNPKIQKQSQRRRDEHSREERNSIAREAYAFNRFEENHPREANILNNLEELFGVLVIRLEDLIDEYSDEGVRNSEAVEIYQRWLRRADRSRAQMVVNLSPRYIFLWIRSIRNALHGQHRIVRAFGQEFPDDQGFQEVKQLRFQAARVSLQALAIPLVQVGRQEVEGRGDEPIQPDTPLREIPHSREPENVETSEVDNSYIKSVLAEVSRNPDGSWDINESKVLPFLESFVRFRAVRILIEQNNQIVRRRAEMTQSWYQANSDERTQIIQNIQRAKQTILNARRLRNQLQTDAGAAERLGRLTTGLPDNYLEILKQISSSRSMTGYNGEKLPSHDYTRQMLVQRFHALENRLNQATVWILAREVVQFERNRQAAAVSAYINAIFHRMPFLRYTLENNLFIAEESVRRSVGRGYYEILDANRRARNAVNEGRVDAFSMAPAIEAALIRLPESIRAQMRQLIQQERSSQTVIDTLEGIGMASGAFLMVFIPVFGPELAFAAGVALTAQGEAKLYFQQAVADSSASPEEDNLGVARPGAFELWMNRLGPIIDIAFAGGGQIIGSISRESRIAGSAIRSAQVDSELAEAGIRELSTAERAVNTARITDDMDDPFLELGNSRLVNKDSISAPSTRRLRDATQQMEDEVASTLSYAQNTDPSRSSRYREQNTSSERLNEDIFTSNHIPQGTPRSQIRQSIEILNSHGERHGLTILSDGRLIRCSDECMEIALSIRERSLALFSPDETEGLGFIIVRLNEEAREIERTASQISSLSQNEIATAEVELLGRAKRLEMEMSDLEQAILEHGPILGSGDEGFFSNIEVGSSVAYVDEAGTLGIARRVDLDTWVIETRPRPRTNYPRGEYQVPTRSGLYFDLIAPDVQIPLNRFHAVGPDLGHESPHGILAGVAEINQGAQRVVERRIRGIIEDVAADNSIKLRVTVKRHSGTDFIRSVDYELLAQRSGGSVVPIHKERIYFEDPSRHPDVVQPDIMNPWSADNINEYLAPQTGLTSEALTTGSRRRLRDIQDSVSIATARRLENEAQQIISQLREISSHFRGSGEWNRRMRITIRDRISELDMRIIQHSEMGSMKDRIEDARGFISIIRATLPR